MSRQTFVIQVYSDGPAMLENLGTQERVSLSDLSAVGPQIERWLAAPEAVGVRRPAHRPGSGNGAGTDGRGATPTEQPGSAS